MSDAMSKVGGGLASGGEGMLTAYSMIQGARHGIPPGVILQGIHKAQFEKNLMQVQQEILRDPAQADSFVRHIMLKQPYTLPEMMGRLGGPGGGPSPTGTPMPRGGVVGGPDANMSPGPGANTNMTDQIRRLAPGMGVEMDPATGQIKLKVASAEDRPTKLGYGEEFTGEKVGGRRITRQRVPPNAFAAAFDPGAGGEPAPTPPLAGAVDRRLTSMPQPGSAPMTPATPQTFGQRLATFNPPKTEQQTAVMEGRGDVPPGTTAKASEIIGNAKTAEEFKKTTMETKAGMAGVWKELGDPGLVDAINTVLPQTQGGMFNPLPRIMGQVSESYTFPNALKSSDPKISSAAGRVQRTVDSIIPMVRSAAITAKNLRITFPEIQLLGQAKQLSEGGMTATQALTFIDQVKEELGRIQSVMDEGGRTGGQFTESAETFREPPTRKVTGKGGVPTDVTQRTNDLIQKWQGMR